MKTSITVIATSIVCLLSITSCVNENEAFIKKVESTQTELKQQDSLLVSYRSELSSFVFSDTTKSTNSEDSLLYQD